MFVFKMFIFFDVIKMTLFLNYISNVVATSRFFGVLLEFVGAKLEFVIILKNSSVIYPEKKRIDTIKI